MGLSVGWGGEGGSQVALFLSLLGFVQAIIKRRKFRHRRRDASETAFNFFLAAPGPDGRGGKLRNLQARVRWAHSCSFTWRRLKRVSERARGSIFRNRLAFDIRSLAHC